MIVKKTSVFIMTLLVSLGLIFALGLQSAEAKRLGSGGSFGQSKPSYARQATPPAAKPVPGQSTAPAAAGARNWMGPLAGLAAGGLLAALFFGGAFDGLKPMDFILIALLAFGAYLLIRALRKPATAQPGLTPYANTGASLNDTGRENTSPGYGASGFRAAVPVPLLDAPQWFNEESFLQGAQHHFTSLQKAWDANDLNALHEYFTPDMFAILRDERAQLGNINNVTEVQELNAQLLDLTREGDAVVASVLFQGRVRENYGVPEDIAEIWHVRHSAEHAQGDWLISGIQQYQHPLH
ncbi:MAG TPA: TIM44-like domain-containing protein [Halothiobacillus sp.]|nr:TIM44-like domain-containing protein [Halothiobacillus sp.]